MGQFGDKFRNEREKKGLSLDDVSNVTKIGARMLQAIEEEHFDQLPGGVFNRGFIRAYAKHLGLNGEDAVTDYLACLRQAQIDAQGPWEPDVRNETGGQVRGQVRGSEAPSLTVVNQTSRASYIRPALKTSSLPSPPITESRPPALSVQGSVNPGLASQGSTNQESAKLESANQVPSNPRLSKRGWQIPGSHNEELPGLQLPRADDVRRPRRFDSVKRTSNDKPWTLIAASALVVILCAALWIRHSHDSQSQALQGTGAPSENMQNSVPASSINQSASAPSSTPNYSQSVGSAAKSTSDPKPGPHVLASASSSAGPAKPVGATPHSLSSTMANESATVQSVEKGSDVTVRTFNPSKPTPPNAGASNSTASSKKPAEAAKPFTLVIRATESSWIAVTADGQPSSHETLIAPAHTSIRANREIIARIGNAAGISFLLNGKEIPAQGAEAEVKTFVFDSNGMRIVSNQAPVPNQ